MSEQPELSQRLRLMAAGGFNRALELVTRAGARGRFMSPILCVLFGFAALAVEPDEASALSQRGAVFTIRIPSLPGEQPSTSRGDDVVAELAAAPTEPTR